MNSIMFSSLSIKKNEILRLTLILEKASDSIPMTSEYSKMDKAFFKFSTELREYCYDLKVRYRMRTGDEYIGYQKKCLNFFKNGLHYVENYLLTLSSLPFQKSYHHEAINACEAILATFEKWELELASVNRFMVEIYTLALTISDSKNDKEFGWSGTNDLLYLREVDALLVIAFDNAYNGDDKEATFNILLAIEKMQYFQPYLGPNKDAIDNMEVFLMLESKTF